MLDDIVSRLKKVYDPEIPINIYDLGLVYDIVIGEGEKPNVDISMTMTSPTCPMSDLIVASVKRILSDICDVVKVELVWTPTWNPRRISSEALALLDLPAQVRRYN